MIIVMTQIEAGVKRRRLFPLTQIKRVGTLLLPPIVKSGIQPKRMVLKERLSGKRGSSKGLEWFLAPVFTSGQRGSQ